MRRALILLLLAAAPAAAQARFPVEDGQGRALIQPETLETALFHQQVVIDLLLALLVLCLGALVWLGFAFLRMQYTVERVAEAVRRVDLLGEAFRSVNADWDRTLRAPDSEPTPPDVIDLSDELPLPVTRRRSRR